MDRRQFFRGLAGAAVAIANLDPERLLWVPGTKKIFLPPPAVRFVDPPMLFDQISATTLRHMREAHLEDSFFIDGFWQRIQLHYGPTSGGNYIQSPYNFTLDGNYSAS